MLAKGAALGQQDRSLGALAGIRSVIAGWGEYSKASRWMNDLEDRFTTRGDWTGR
jgi:hypothetical protein